MDRPRITYQKWWHKFIPSYRRKIQILDDIFGYNWRHGGEEENKKNLHELLSTGKVTIGDKTFYL